MNYHYCLFQFDERGPYIYTTKTKKIEIKFGTGTVSFKQYKTQSFDAKATALKCPKCSENDQVKS